AVPHRVGAAAPRAEVAAPEPVDEALPRRAVAHRGDRDDLVGLAGTVRGVEVPEETGVVVGGDRGRVVAAHRVLELELTLTHHRVHVVDEQHVTAPLLGQNISTFFGTRRQGVVGAQLGGGERGDVEPEPAEVAPEFGQAVAGHGEAGGVVDLGQVRGDVLGGGGVGHGARGGAG